MPFRSAVRGLLPTLVLVACGGGGDDADPGVVADAAVGPTVDAADEASPADLAAAFCREAAQSKCAWAFGCVSGSARAEVLGLPGNDEAACAEAAAAECIADTADRLARGTIDLALDKKDDCVAGLLNAPCQMTDPETWVRQWREFADDRCAKVTRGNVDAGGACETRRDCNVDSLLCVNGECVEGEVRDLTRDCEAAGLFEGQLNADPACPGEVCVQVGRNGDGKDGMCTVDCGGDSGHCPDGTACVQVVPEGGPATFYCTQPCEEGDTCPNDFSCVRVNATGLDMTRHCWVSAP
jgi:hypothetical protein